jgi:hypothetical protein
MSPQTTLRKGLKLYIICQNLISGFLATGRKQQAFNTDDATSQNRGVNILTSKKYSRLSEFQNGFSDTYEFIFSRFSLLRY